MSGPSESPAVIPALTAWTPRAARISGVIITCGRLGIKLRLSPTGPETIGMQELTPEGRKIVDDLARRHGVGSDAVAALLCALELGNGAQAQFTHTDLGGMGQWSQGGMIMIGDMFNSGLKARVDALCIDLAGFVASQPPPNAEAGGFQSQSQGPGGVSLFVAGTGPTGRWWPRDLGSPASTG